MAAPLGGGEAGFEHAGFELEGLVGLVSQLVWPNGPGAGPC